MQLEAALKRERKLRIELFEAKKRISELEQKERDEQGKRDSTMAQLKDTLLVKASQLDRTQKRARALRESFHKVRNGGHPTMLTSPAIDVCPDTRIALDLAVHSQVERANAELQRCIADNYPIFAASAAASRFLDIQVSLLPHELRRTERPTCNAVAPPLSFVRAAECCQGSRRGCEQHQDCHFTHPGGAAR